MSLMGTFFKINREIELFKLVWIIYSMQHWGLIPPSLLVFGHSEENQLEKLLPLRSQWIDDLTDRSAACRPEFWSRSAHLLRVLNQTGPGGLSVWLSLVFRRNCAHRAAWKKNRVDQETWMCFCCGSAGETILPLLV